MWALDDKGDIVLKNGIEQIEKVVDQVKQRLTLKLLMFNGEWHLHEFEGVNWTDNGNNYGQLGKKIRHFNIEEQIRKIILEDKDVKQIKSLNLNFDNLEGELMISCELILHDNSVINL